MSRNTAVGVDQTPDTVADQEASMRIMQDKFENVK